MSIYYLIISNTCELCYKVRIELNKKKYKIRLIDVNKLLENKKFLVLFFDKEYDYVIKIPTLYVKENLNIKKINLKDILK